MPSLLDDVGSGRVLGLLALRQGHTITKEMFLNQLSLVSSSLKRPPSIATCHSVALLRWREADNARATCFASRSADEIVK